MRDLILILAPRIPRRSIPYCQRSRLSAVSESVQSGAPREDDRTRYTFDNIAIQFEDMHSGKTFAAPPCMTPDSFLPLDSVSWTSLSETPLNRVPGSSH